MIAADSVAVFCVRLANVDLHTKVLYIEDSIEGVSGGIIDETLDQHIGVREQTMQIKQGHNSDFKFGRLKSSRKFLTASLFDDVFESFAGDWLYDVFDEPESIDELVNESLRDSWDAVGLSISDSLGRFDELHSPSLEVLEESDIVESR